MSGKFANDILRSSHAEPVVLQSTNSKVRATVMKTSSSPTIVFDSGPAQVVSTTGIDRCTQLSYQVHRLQQELAAVHERLRWAMDRVPKEERMVRELATLTDSQKSEMGKLKALVGRLELEKAELERKNDDLQKDKERLLKVVRKYQSPASGPTKQIAELQKALVEAEQERIASHQHHNQVVIMLERELAKLRKEREAVQYSNQTAVEALRAANDRIVNLEQDCSHLKALLEEAQSKSEEIQNRAKRSISSSEDAIREFEERLQQAVSELQERDLEVVKLKEQLFKMRESKREHETTIEELLIRIRYHQELSEAQAVSLQKAREALLDEKQKRKVCEKVGRLEHLYAQDAKRWAGRTFCNCEDRADFSERSEFKGKTRREETPIAVRCKCCGSPTKACLGTPNAIHIETDQRRI